MYIHQVDLGRKVDSHAGPIRSLPVDQRLQPVPDSRQRCTDLGGTEVNPVRAIVRAPIRPKGHRNTTVRSPLMKTRCSST
jgi:hypothetical protein